MFPELNPEQKLKFDLLREHYRGVCGLLQELRGLGYIPDHLQSRRLGVVIDELYERIEKKA